MPLGSEAGSVQRPFVRYAVAAGWTYLSPEQALALRTGGVTSPVLDGVLVGQLQKLNPGIVDAARAAEVVKRLVRVRPTIEGNLDAWEFLRGLKTVFVEAEKRERNVRLLDLDQPTANVFHVTDEFTFSNGTPPDLRADIVFFINGVPVLIVETKRATARDGIAQALDDLRYYHERGPELLALLQLHALTHLVRFYYGATWNLSGKALFNWREEVAESEAERLWSAPAERSGDGALAGARAGPAPPRAKAASLPPQSTAPAASFERLCKSFVSPGRLLKVLSDFILFTRKDGELSKVVLRPHQMRAVARCV
jgi:type I restriction enzyme R subunit